MGVLKNIERLCIRVLLLVYHICTTPLLAPSPRLIFTCSRHRHNIAVLSRLIRGLFYPSVYSTTSTLLTTTFNYYLRGVYLTDLTFIEDGNPDLVKHKSSKSGTQTSDLDLINFKKRDLVYKVIQEVLVYQQVCLQFSIL